MANYQRRDLKKVETVTIDMNAGYVNVIQEVFPQAKIIIDRFHLVQLISRAMNMTRVRVMNSLRIKWGRYEKIPPFKKILATIIEIQRGFILYRIQVL
ncbi:transposase [Virgibacillus soli]|uniref:Transposase n=1 Tax=Paracerasibacillus soli TaxID=480284 RepID=A0ABU5CUL0_9BACI|nr:transposase [Virgibacillus soli]MDY0409925.1 transposase [Virgibacillus soli]